MVKRTLFVFSVSLFSATGCEYVNQAVPSEESEETQPSEFEEIDNEIEVQGYYVGRGDVPFDSDRPHTRMVIQLLDESDHPVVGGKLSVNRLSDVHAIKYTSHSVMEPCYPPPPDTLPEPYPEPLPELVPEPYPEEAPVSNWTEETIPEEAPDNEPDDAESAENVEPEPSDDSPKVSEPPEEPVALALSFEKPKKHKKKEKQKKKHKKTGQIQTGVTVENPSSNIFTIIIAAGSQYKVVASARDFEKTVEFISFDEKSPVDVNFPIRLFPYYEWHCDYGYKYECYGGDCNDYDYYEVECYDERCYDEECYDERCYDEGCYDERCYDEGCYDERCYDEGCYDERCYDEGCYDDGCYDIGCYDDGCFEDGEDDAYKDGGDDDYDEDEDEDEDAYIYDDGEDADEDQKIKVAND